MISVDKQHPPVPLEFMQAGELGRVASIEGDERLVARLCEMGLRHGCELRMVCSGAPCIIALGNQRLTFRAEENATVMVEVDAPANNR